jgi:hypothetical protein
MKKNKLIKILASISAMGAIGTGTAIGISSCGGGDTPPPTPTEIIITSDISGSIDATAGVAGSCEFEVKDNLGGTLNNPTVNISNITANSAVAEGPATLVSSTTYRLQ